LDDFHARVSNFSDFRELTIDEGGHNLHVHTPAELAAAVRPFLASLNK
jgi:pimeloyl-ACP methyl ester carboxylesterase